MAPHVARPRRTTPGLLAPAAAGVVLLAVSAPAAREAAAPVLALDQRTAILERAGSLPRLRSLLVSVGGDLVEEHYFNGTTARSQANLKSASKTLISILVGIAVDRGHVAVDQPVSDFFPDELAGADAARRGITVGDLLSMQSGLETTSNRNYGRWVQSRNWVRHVLTRPMVDRPGGRMIYSTGSTHLLSAILTRATGMSTLEFGRRYLARPLGITLPAWLRDPQGIYFGGNEMTLTARAMLAVGDLYRRGGSIDGFEVVSREWIRESLRPRTVSRYSRRQYGYGWWMRSLAGHRTYYAWGYGGQFIFVIPSLDSVIVATSSPNPGQGRRHHRRELDALFERQLVPAIRRARAGQESARNRWEFLLTIAPLPIPNGTALPVNPIATF